MAKLLEELKTLIPIYGLQKHVDIMHSELGGTEPASCKRFKAAGRALIRTMIVLPYQGAFVLAAGKGIELLYNVIEPLISR